VLKIQAKERDANTPDMFYPVQDKEQKLSVTSWGLKIKPKGIMHHCSDQPKIFSFAVQDEPPSLELGW